MSISKDRSNEFINAEDSRQYARERQAAAYSQLVSTYEGRHELLQPVRHVVLDCVLRDLPKGSTALEVGCGCGASLALIAARGFEANGVDFSPEMVAVARERSGCRVECLDFIDHTFSERYDLVFAQAFVHLFPKEAVRDVIRKLQGLARRRLFFSTTINDSPSEGWEHKDGVVQFRSRYTRAELRELIINVTHNTAWKADSFELKDPLGKLWLDVILTWEP